MISQVGFGNEIIDGRWEMGDGGPLLIEG